MAKYHEIYYDLLSRIQSKEIEANSYLPSESELMKTYSASRDTVRKALQMLAEKGYILKEKGRGSRVLDQEVVTFPMSGITSFKELKDTIPGEVHTEVIQCELLLDPIGQKELNLGPDQPVDKVVRVRSIDGQRVILDTDYLNPAIVGTITPEIAQDSLYEYLENVKNLPISFAKKAITVEPAGSQEKKLLDMECYDLLVVVRSCTYLEDATLFQYTVSRHRPDKFKFLDFARRSRL